MPFVPAAITATFSAVSTFAASSAVASFLVNTVSSLALSALATAIRGRPEVSTPGITTQTTTAGGTIPQRLIFGRYATAGQMVAPMMVYQSDGNPNEWLVYVISLADKPVTGLGRIFVDGKALTIDGSPAASQHGDTMGATVLDTDTDSLRNKIYVRFHDGRQTAADAYLRRVFGTYPERPWTADMIGTGVAYAVVTFKGKAQDGDYSGFPAIKFEVDGHPLYDPRDATQDPGNEATWKFTRNAAVMAYNVLRGIDMPGGGTWGVGTRKFHLPSVIAAMNLCDQQVPRTDGTMRPRYQAGLEVSVSDEPHQALMEFVKAMGGDVADMGGTWLLAAGEPGGPVLSITDDDIIVTDSRSLKPYPGLDETINAIHASYPDPAQQWEAKEAVPIYNAAFEAADGGRRLIAEVDFPSVPYPQQVRALMGEMLADHRRMRTHVITLPPDALGLKLGDHDAWTSESNFYTNKLFKISALRVDPLSLCVAVTKIERDPSDYDDDAARDGVLPTVPSPEPVTPVIVGVTGWDVQAVNAGGRPGIRMVWNPEINARALSWVIRLASDGSEANSGTTSDMARGENVQTAGLRPSTAYLVTGRLVIPGRGTESVTVPVTTLPIGMSWEDLTGEVRDSFEELEGWLEGTGPWFRDLMDTIDALRDAVGEVDYGGFTHREVIFRRAMSEVDRARAEFREDIIAATGPTSALAARIEQVNASIPGAVAGAVDGIVARVEETEEGLLAQADSINMVTARTDRGTASGLMRVSAESGPAGVQTRIGIRAEASAGDVSHSAAWYLDAKADGTSQALVQANRFALITGPTGLPQVPFVVDGTQIVMDADVWIKNLSIGPDKVQVDGLSRLWSANFAKLATSTNNTWSEVGRITFTPYAAGSKILVIGNALLSVIETAAYVPVGIMRVLINGDEVFRRALTADRKIGDGSYATDDWVSIVAMGTAIAGANSAVVQVISGSDNYTASLDATKLFVTEFKR